MKKLAFVITQSEMGGAQKNILLLCKSLRTTYDITVYSSPNGQFIDELNLLNIKHIPVKDMVREINLIKDFKCYGFLLKEFRKFNYDIVHCHSSKAGILAREAAFKANISKIIYTAHGFVFNEPMSKLKKIVYTWLEKYESRHCHNIICVNPNEIQTAKELAIKPLYDFVYIPNGIEFHEDKSNNNKNCCSNMFTFGLVANFYETKGHRYLIEAFNELTDKYDIKAKLVLIGGGLLEKEMKLLASKNKNIIFLGYRSDAEALMQSFDCFIMSSVKEGFPFVLLEAIKNKLPVISTDVGAVSEILDNGNLGYLVPHSNSKELSKAMLHVINNKNEAHDKAIKAYNTCSEKYSIDNMIKQTKHLYEN